MPRRSEAAAESGFAVLLHQPMEPLDGSVSPGPGAITVGRPRRDSQRAAVALQGAGGRRRQQPHGLK